MTEFDLDLQGNPEVRHYFIINNEVRRVPIDWEHPKDESGHYKALFSRDHYPRYTEEEIQRGLEDGWVKSREEMETWYMPDFSDVPEEKMGICAYETTSEGTPISPVFPNTPKGRFELLKYCTENCTVLANQKTGIEAWTGIFGSGLALVDAKTGTVEIHEPHQDIPEA